MGIDRSLTVLLVVVCVVALGLALVVPRAALEAGLIYAGF
jgi:hypothetical protein